MAIHSDSLKSFLIIDFAKFSLISLCLGTAWDCLVLVFEYQS